MKYVEDLLRANIECIWIRTYEEMSVINDIKEMISENANSYFANMSVQQWSNTEGLTKLSRHSYEKQEEPNVKIREIPALFNAIRKYSNSPEGSSNVFILRDLHAMIKEPKTLRYIRDLKEYNFAFYNPIIVISPYCEIPDEVSKLFKVVDYDLPNEEEIIKLVINANNNLKMISSKAPEKGYCPVSDDEIVQLSKSCIGLTLKEISMLLNESIITRNTLDRELIMQNKIQAIKKSGVLDYKVPEKTLDDIGGNAALKTWLYEARDAFSPEAREFGLDLPHGYLALGIPGTSKTASAEAFAGMMKYPLISFNIGKVMNKMVGESEKRIESALNLVKACAPCVLLIDEAEKVLGGISSSNNTDSGITARIFQSILKFMNDNDSGVYVIMTSNDVSQLPPELTRAGRLDAIWYYGIPSNEERREIFQIHFDKRSRDVDDDLIEAAVINSEHFTGAEVEQAVKNSLRKAFVRSRKDGDTDIKVEDIISACHEVIPVYDSSREKILALDHWCKGRARRTDEAEQDTATDTSRFRQALEL